MLRRDKIFNQDNATIQCHRAYSFNYNKIASLPNPSQPYKNSPWYLIQKMPPAPPMSTVIHPTRSVLVLFPPVNAYSNQNAVSQPRTVSYPARLQDQAI